MRIVSLLIRLLEQFDLKNMFDFVDSRKKIQAKKKFKRSQLA